MLIEITLMCKSQKEAEKLATALLKAKLVACANYWKTTSLYSWKGKRKKHGEFLLSLKASSTSIHSILRAVAKLSSYDLPAVYWKPVQSTHEYAWWVSRETKQTSKAKK